MLRNFVKVIFRYLVRSRFFTLLNIAGLSTGMACCIIIYLFIKNELSQDRFHRDGENIYRVIRESEINGIPYDIGVTSGPYGPALLQDYNGKIQSVTRAASFDGLLIKHEDKSFLEDRMLLADSNFFEFFSYPLLYGDPQTVLDNPNSVVISKAFAAKYFGNDDPIGKVINVDLEYDLSVTGVLDDLPVNSHLQFETVGSIQLIEKEQYFQNWWNNLLYTYARIDDPLDVDYLNAHFSQFMDKYFADDFRKIGNRTGLKLEPLHDIYFNYETRYERNIAHGNKLYVYVFGSLALLLIALASINYINLATAQSVERAKEVGIRKTLGSSQRSIAAQFLSESLALCLMAMVLAVIIAQLTIPLFNSSFATSIPPVHTDNHLWFFLGAMVLIICLLSGSYPAFLLSSFKPIRVLKGEVKGNFQYLMVRKALVVFQFGISALMIMATLFIGKQLQYMHEKELGFNSDQVLKVRINNPAVSQRLRSFKERLLAEKNILNVSATSGHPGGFYDASTVKIEGEEERVRMRTVWADENLVGTLNIRMVAGRFFSEDAPYDSIGSVVLNETAVRYLGWTAEEAIGKRAFISQFDSVYKEVIGVVEDFHFQSLKETIEPLVISNRETSRNLLIKVSGENVNDAMEDIEKIWNSYESGFPIEMVFLDDVIGRLYAGEANQGKMFRVFSGISVLIACFGILGLSTYIAVQRKKEIGIRKVLGASTSQLSILLTKDLVALVLLANMLAAPLAYLILKKWSENFAYRATFEPLIFLLAALLVTAIALVIVSVNAARAANEDPVKALRPE
jgi:putative ABC transport system permease protein